MPAVGVCGFGRCGSTMVMTMLAAGGLPPVDGSSPGCYEVSDLAHIFKLGPAYFAGRAVKLLDSVLYYGVPLASEWRFVWLDRDPKQQARSQVKFISPFVTALPDGAAASFAASYGRDRPAALGALRRHGEVTVLRYEDMLANPRKGAKRLRAVFPDLDIDAATAVVHRRDGACRPDLSVEIALTKATA